jgi:hypothetical protein
VITLRSVSRAWNKTFSSADFCIGVIKTHFRPIWERRYRGLTADQQLVEKEALTQWLPGATKERIRRQNGQYQSMSVYHQSSHLVSEWQYRNGRIASKQSQNSILVEDLRANLKETYMDENRVDLENWLLADEYLVAAKNGP